MFYLCIDPLLPQDKTRSIAGFDLDYTLIKPFSLSPKDNKRWVWMYENVVDKIKELHDSNYRIVIFANQSLKYFKEKPFKNKMRQIQKDLPFIEIRVAYGHNFYRKPYTFMRRDDDLFDKNSFFVGDAAGRENDHSACDLFFAKNLSIKFFTPEEFFLGEKEKIKIIPCKKPLLLEKKHVICMVGYPGSGKTTFANSLPLEYQIVTKIEELFLHLEKGKTCVIDKCNPDIESRKKWIEAAKKKNVPIRCFRMTTTRSISEYYNSFMMDPAPAIDFCIYQNLYKRPSIYEGFIDVVDVTL